MIISAPDEVLAMVGVPRRCTKVLYRKLLGVDCLPLVILLSYLRYVPLLGRSLKGRAISTSVARCVSESPDYVD